MLTLGLGGRRKGREYASATEYAIRARLCVRVRGWGWTRLGAVVLLLLLQLLAG